MFYCLQAPEINWTAVIENLDHEGFYVSSEAAFSFFMSVYHRACQVGFLVRISAIIWPQNRRIME